MINLYIASVLILMIIIVVVLERHNKRILSYIERLKSESDIANNKFINELSTQKETEVKLKSILENKISILQQLAGVSYEYENSREALLREYKNIMSVGKLGGNVFKDICEIVNIKDSGIIDYLKKEYPMLNEDDLHFISLICCGFSTSAICAFYGYKSPEVVYVRKSRLSRRMRLKEPINDYISDTIKRLNSVND